MKKRNQSVEWDDLPHKWNIFKKFKPFTEIEMDVLQDCLGIFLPDKLQSIVIPLILQKHKISLRALEWLATNYSKRKKILIVNKQGIITDIHCSYNRILSEKHRKLFDSYKRALHLKKSKQDEKDNIDLLNKKKKQIYFQAADVEDASKMRTYQTTIGQICFLGWVIHSEILEYAEAHIDEITEDIREQMKKHKDDQNQIPISLSKISKNSKKKKRKEITKSPIQKCMVYQINGEKIEFLNE